MYATYILKQKMSREETFSTVANKNLMKILADIYLLYVTS